MKEFLKRRMELDDEHTRAMGQHDMCSSSERQQYFEIAGIIIRQQMAIEATVNLVRAQLVVLVCDSLDEAKELLGKCDMQQVKNLLESAGSVARDAFSQEGFEWESLHRHFANYQQQYRTKGVPSGSDYCRRIDEIKESAKLFVRDYCLQYNIPEPL